MEWVSPLAVFPESLEQRVIPFPLHLSTIVSALFSLRYPNGYVNCNSVLQLFGCHIVADELCPYPIACSAHIFPHSMNSLFIPRLYHYPRRDWLCLHSYGLCYLLERHNRFLLSLAGVTASLHCSSSFQNHSALPCFVPPFLHLTQFSLGSLRYLFGDTSPRYGSIGQKDLLSALDSVGGCPLDGPLRNFSVVACSPCARSSSSAKGWESSTNAGELNIQKDEWSSISNEIS